MAARAAVDAVGADGGSALNSAALQGDERVAATLVEARANVDARGLERDTPLIRASIRGHQGIVSLMLRSGADVEARDQHMRTALLYAASQGHTRCVELLLGAGADAEACDGKGSTALLLAVARRHQGVTELFESFEKNRLVLTLHVSPPAADGSLTTSCTSMQGEELVACEVAGLSELGRVRDVLAKELGVLSFTAILPCGRVLGRDDDRSPISSFASALDGAFDEGLV